ncbi:hypothetical protein AB0B15_14440 [Streptomyces sp. NPDC045456]|uniref:hypothetical protein n=1 Tax=Streptomyces sp. NPDC045456 TaxID=3155254 RepID=UPI0033FAE5F3
MTSSKPAGREVVSLDARAKQRREALGEPTTFELKGVEFVLPPFQTLPMDLQERVASREDALGILRIAAGADIVKDMIGAGYTIDDMELISEEWMARSGVEPGESAASSGS